MKNHKFYFTFSNVANAEISMAIAVWKMWRGQDGKKLLMGGKRALGTCLKSGLFLMTL